ncbi:carbon-nitrogen hydrolase family protein [Pectinatus haikarae]|uniref:Amidohydrolase n=1 Tax=Pectinatus haikarae TaxID=349096 RepID=A0ABT9Y659_9FIRM|nr:carbon-nitrogen hydrolase family protein [Pectinatus haikarae]MDQ0203199.1 putative amidohydrolase [Pectinatus haikarae]
MFDIITVSVVTFQTEWGNKEANLKRMMKFIDHAAAKGSDLIVMPEMCLTGYDDEPTAKGTAKMQKCAAETMKGPSVQKIAEKAKKENIYVMFGMPELFQNNIYNSLVTCAPNGKVMAYRKIHLALQEANWAKHGSTPLIVDTPWGGIGCGVCYDSYNFPELIRYYAAKGCRLYINATAFAKSRNTNKPQITLEASVIMNDIYIASANLGGIDLYNDFSGGSNIMGPSSTYGQVAYYCGHHFNDPDAQETGLYTATIDLSKATRSIYQKNDHEKTPDFKPEIYAAMYKDLANSI